MSIGDRVRQLRQKQGMSAAQLASVSAVSGKAIEQLESGATKSPTFENGLRLARAFGVSPYWLAFGKGAAARDLLAEIDDLRQRVEVLERRRRNSPNDGSR